MNILRKKQIVKLIDQIKDKKILRQIYKIILNENINYTRNLNGIFINLNEVPDDKLIKIENFLLSIYI